MKKPGSKGLVILFYFVGVDRIMGTSGGVLVLGRRTNDFSEGFKDEMIHE